MTPAPATDSDATRRRGPVLVGVDGSSDSDIALQWACDEARQTGTEVVAVTVVPVYPAMGAPEGVAPVTEAGAMLRNAVARVVPAGQALRTVLLCAPPAPGLRAEAERQGASLVVVGRRGAGRFSRMLVGSVSTALCHSPTVPLAVVPGPGPDRPAGAPRRILVGVDGSPPSLAALRWAAEDARMVGGRVEVVCAEPDPGVAAALANPRPPGAPGEVAGAIDALVGDWHPASIQVASGDPRTVLLQASSRFDLVVVGASRTSSVRLRHFGSVSQGLARHAPVPVVIVPVGVSGERHPEGRLAAVG